MWHFNEQSGTTFADATKTEGGLDASVVEGVESEISAQVVGTGVTLTNAPENAKTVLLRTGAQKISGQATFSGWYRLIQTRAGTDTYPSLIKCGNYNKGGFYLQCATLASAGEGLTFVLDGGMGNCGGTDRLKGQMHHVTISFKSGAQGVYIDGQRVLNVTWPTFKAWDDVLALVGDVRSAAADEIRLRPTAMSADWAKTMLQDFFDASTSVDGYKGGKALGELADLDSLVGYFLAMEMTGNYDAASNSRFASKDLGRPFAFGPVWDCDLAFGSKWAYDMKWTKSREPEQWILAKRSFYREWADDPSFCTRLWHVYWAKARAAYQAGIAQIDRLQEGLKEPLAANAIRWGAVRNERQEDAAAFVKSYMTRCLAWLDGWFADVPTLMAAIKDESAHPYEKADDVLAIEAAGRIRTGRSLEVSASVRDDAIATVGVYVNGVKFGAPQTVADGRICVRIPSASLLPEEAGPNCISLVAWGADGTTVVARNYALVVRDRALAGTLLLFR